MARCAVPRLGDDGMVTVGHHKLFRLVEGGWVEFQVRGRGGKKPKEVIAIEDLIALLQSSASSAILPPDKTAD